MRNVRNVFRAKADTSQELIHEAIMAYLNVVRDTFELVRNENVARESERDPGFRRCIEASIKAGMQTMQTICKVINS